MILIYICLGTLNFTSLSIYIFISKEVLEVQVHNSKVRNEKTNLLLPLFRRVPTVAPAPVCPSGEVCGHQCVYFFKKGDDLRFEGRINGNQ